MKKFFRPLYLFAYYIVFYLWLFIATYFKAQNQGYTEVGLKKIFGNPAEYLYSWRVSTNMVTPRNIIPNGVAKTVKITVSSPDGWLAITEIATIILVVLLAIFAFTVFFGRTAEGGVVKKADH